MILLRRTKSADRILVLHPSSIKIVNCFPARIPANMKKSASGRSFGSIRGFVSEDGVHVRTRVEDFPGVGLL